MATLAWPESDAEARELPRYPLDFVACVECGHIYNARFEYVNVPYRDKPNLMYNRGSNWSQFLHELAEELLRRVPSDGTVVEIGYGDASFLHGLAERRPDVRCIGFDPHGASYDVAPNVELRQELFLPQRHIEALEPALIISRHVLEHLENPLGFIEQVAFVADWLAREVNLYFEVPCVDNAVRFGRVVDFYYEHNSHFTTTSFKRMLERSQLGDVKVGHGYNGEVIYGIAVAGGTTDQHEHVIDAVAFHGRTDTRRGRIAAQLAKLAGAGTAIWGGTGKGAAFINCYGLDAARFPIVVDSDAEKAGTHVPGTGQLIRYRDYLLEHPPRTVIIPAHWRAQDIIEEMARAGIEPVSVLIEHDGELVEFGDGSHPYAYRAES